MEEGCWRVISIHKFVDAVLGRGPVRASVCRGPCYPLFATLQALTSTLLQPTLWCFANLVKTDRPFGHSSATPNRPDPHDAIRDPLESREHRRIMPGHDELRM